MTSTLELPGLRTEPLSAYLCAVGVLRVLHNHLGESQARGVWLADEFAIHGEWTQQSLVRFFTERYRPTPVVSPWSGGSGFWPKDNKTSLNAIMASDDPRLEDYRYAITESKRVLDELGIIDKFDAPGAKLKLLREFRSRLPDRMLQWADAVYVLGQTDVSYMPLLGTGGNDGRLEFSQNYMGNVVSIMLDPKGKEKSAAWLTDALFGTSTTPLLNASVGQFHPGGVGGPNAASGLVGESLVNPWTYVLMIEGAMAWAGSVSRRMNSSLRGRAVFPFTVTPVAAGVSTLVGPDSDSGRGEVWLPVWSQPADYGEVAHLLSEGRAVVGRRPARSGVDFAVAVAQLGVDRGIRSFVRYSITRRSGLAYLATPVGAMAVRHKPSATLLDEVLPWIDALRQYSKSEGAGALLRSAVRNLDDSILQFSSLGDNCRLGEVLRRIGGAERVLVRKASARFSEVPPLPPLSERWLRDANDQSAEFRLAASAASVRDTETRGIRGQLEPVDLSRYKPAWIDPVAGVKGGHGDAGELFAELMWRRAVACRRLGLLHPVAERPVFASACDVASFCRGDVDSERLIDLLYALSALRWNRPKQCIDERALMDGYTCPLPTPYAILKSVFGYADGSEAQTRRAEPQGQGSRGERWDLETLALLRAGDMPRAIVRASRRLTALNRRPIVMPAMAIEFSGDWELPRVDVRRILGALLFPLHPLAAERICQSITEPS